MNAAPSSGFFVRIRGAVGNAWSMVLRLSVRGGSANPRLNQGRTPLGYVWVCFCREWNISCAQNEECGIFWKTRCQKNSRGCLGFHISEPSGTFTTSHYYYCVTNPSKFPENLESFFLRIGENAELRPFFIWEASSEFESLPRHVLGDGGQLLFRRASNVCPLLHLRILTFQNAVFRR